MDKLELLYPVENAYRHHSLLDGMWYYLLEREVPQGWERGIAKEKMIPVPCNFPDLFFQRDEREFVGNIWYQKEVYIPKTWLGETVYVRLDGIAHRFHLYINGSEVARNENGYLPVSVDITRQIHYGDKNTIVIKVNNQPSENTIPKGVTKSYQGHPVTMMAPGSPLLGGILKSVHIYTVPATRLLDYQIQFGTISEEKAEIQYSAVVQGNCLVTATLRNRDGKVVATGVGGTATMTVEKPQLWHPTNPYIYRIDFEISRLGKQCDTYTVPLAIRDWDCKQGQFLFNQTPLYLKGKRYPSTLASWGNGVDLYQAKRMFLEMKYKGYNTLIAEAIPMAEEILHLAEKEGIFVLQTVPLQGKEAKAGQGHYPSRYASPEDSQESESIIYSDLWERDKFYNAMIGWILRLPEDLVEGDEASEAYAARLERELEKAKLLGRVFAVEYQVGQMPWPKSVLSQVQVLIVRDNKVRSQARFMQATGRYDSMLNTIKGLQETHPNICILPYFSEDMPNRSSLERETDYHIFSEAMKDCALAGEIHEI